MQWTTLLHFALSPDYFNSHLWFYVRIYLLSVLSKHRKSCGRFFHGLVDSINDDCWNNETYALFTAIWFSSTGHFFTKLFEIISCIFFVSTNKDHPHTDFFHIVIFCSSLKNIRLIYRCSFFYINNFLNIYYGLSKTVLNLKKLYLYDK